ncbi:MAG: hypothetical protein AAB263_12085, partial [Planctomycetota bacterium]
MTDSAPGQETRAAWAWLVLLLAAAILPGHGLLWNHGCAHEPTSPPWVRSVRDVLFCGALIVLIPCAWRLRTAVSRAGWRTLACAALP